MSTHITDITELGKHTDSMQKFLFGESKAKELNFVGELSERKTPSSLKARKTSSKRNLLKAIVHQTLMGRMTTPLTNPIRLPEIKAVRAFIGRGLTITTGLFGRLLTREALPGRGRQRLAFE